MSAKLSRITPFLGVGILAAVLLLSVHAGLRAACTGVCQPLAWYEPKAGCALDGGGKYMACCKVGEILHSSLGGGGCVGEDGSDCNENHYVEKLHKKIQITGSTCTSQCTGSCTVIITDGPNYDSGTFCTSSCGDGIQLGSCQYFCDQ